MEGLKFGVVVQILALMILAIISATVEARQEDMVLYFPLSEGAGNVATDRSGKNNNGTLFGDPKWTVGKNGSGLYFDGKDDYIEIPNILSEKGTIMFWFKPDWDGGAAQDYRLFDASMGDKYFFISKGADHVDITPAAFGFYFEDASDADWQDIDFDPAGVINAGEWYHIAATWQFNGGSAFLYMNGKQAATSLNKLGAMPALNPKPRFGLMVIQYVPSKNGAKGVMDDIAIYNKALTADEITQSMTELGFAVEAAGKLATAWGHIKAK